MFSGATQHGTIPGNVIGLDMSDMGDASNMTDLLRDGSMLLVRRYPFNDGYSFTRYDPSKLIFMRFDVSNTSMSEWVKTENPADAVVEQYQNGDLKHEPFFVKGSDVFYNKMTVSGPVFLKCEEDWYAMNFTDEKYFTIINNPSFTLHNIVTDQVKTIGGMHAWEVVDTEYEPLSDRWFGTPDLDVGYMDTFAGNSTFVNSTPGTGKGHTILDMINATDPSSDEDGSSEEEQESGFVIKTPLHKYLLGVPVEDLVSNSHNVLPELRTARCLAGLDGAKADDDEVHEEESVGGYAQDPNDMTEGSDDEDDSDSDYIPDEDEEEEGEVYEDRFDQEWLNEFYDEKRQDLDGNWYTRRQFYDYYGSDDAWDNLDTNTFQPYRYDEINNVWLSKEEFFQQYSSDRVWDKMTPELCMKRYAIWITYSWSRDLPKHMRHSFVHAMLATY